MATIWYSYSREEGSFEQAKTIKYNSTPRSVFTLHFVLLLFKFPILSLSLRTMSEPPFLVSSNQDMDQEVNQLLTFLNEFQIVPPSAKKAASPYPRRTLGRLPSNKNHRILLDVENCRRGDDGEEDEESLTTAPSMANSGMVRRSWADRMSQALRDWKHNHEQLVERRLVEQRRQLQRQHEREKDKLRNELHQFYQNEFQAWQDEYLSSLWPDQQKRQQVDEENKIPTTAQLPNRTMDKRVFVDSVIRKNPGGTSASRQSWKSPDGKTITRYGNGTRREKNPDGSTVTRFANGDLQTTGSSDESPTKLCYFYGSSGTLRMDQADGSVIYIYPSGQRERHLPDGAVNVLEWAP
eukprot:scaffold2093_cov161-Amphora_coffeaeformis.AAC.3